MFIGEYQYSLDDKGRVVVPSKYREQLGENFVLTKGLDGCLFIYSISEWAIFEQKLKKCLYSRYILPEKIHLV